MKINDTKEKSSAEWYFVHTLAGLSLVTSAAFFSMRVYLEAAGVTYVDFPEAIRWVLAIGVIACFWFWIRMLVDYFRERPANSSVMWGWTLLLGSVVGSLPYFWLIWRPRNRPSMHG